jgi:aspartyl-tRNA(Asn)/glutamyl-tRNA(Gln) amidotransferase subunit A
MKSAIETASAIAQRDISAREVVSEALAAIERTDGALNAWCHVDAAAALAAADAVDAGHVTGPLAGVPFGVKDLEDCEGMPTTRGSRWFANGPNAARDDLHVARLRAAGAIPLGKTTAPEFGAHPSTVSPLLGVTRNPWNVARTPGGSSGGSAATIAAGVVPFATASDGGGSIRTPAAFCGLPGIRQMYGRVPTRGVTWLAQNAVNGALATTVADTALLLDVMSGPHDDDRTCLPDPSVRYLDIIDTLDVSGLRIAFSADLGFCTVMPEVAELCEEAARLLGPHLQSMPMPFDMDVVRAYTKMETVDAFVGLDESLWRDRVDELDPFVQERWRVMPAVTVTQAARVEAIRRRVVQQVADVFADVDVIVTVSTGAPAFNAELRLPTDVGGIPSLPGATVLPMLLASVANLPAVTVPVGFVDGLPVGLQIIGRRFAEDVCLRLARIVEHERPWPRTAPPVAYVANESAETGSTPR